MLRSTVIMNEDEEVVMMMMMMMMMMTSRASVKRIHEGNERNWVFFYLLLPLLLLSGTNGISFIK